MALYFADVDDITFGVQASNVAEVAQFSSTTSNVIMRMFTNNYAATDNLETGVAIGSSNFKTSSSNNLYFGHITGYSNISPVMLMQDNKISVNTVPYSNYSLTVQNGVYSDIFATPLLSATNVDEIFYNIAAYTYVNKAFVSTGTISPAGAVPFTINFKGNSTSYTYTLTCTKGASTTTLGPFTVTSATANYTSTFTSGTYNVSIAVTTPGSGAGSYYTGTNIATFTVAATDSIGSPSVTLSGTPTFSSTYTYVSGIPYYTSGTTITFPSNALAFTNIYNNIDPRTAITNVLSLTGNGSTTNYTYANLFTNVLSYSATNNNSATLTLSGSGSSTINITSTVRNINYQSGVGGTLMSSIGYLGTAVDESTLAMANYTGLPITSAVRMSIPTSESSAITPIVSNLTVYNGTSSTYDSFYSPFEGRFYPQASSVVRGSYAPTLPSLSGSRQYLTIRLNATAALSSFVVTLANSSSVSSVYIAWASVNSAAWYNAKTMFNAGGCAATTYPSDGTGLRFPITLPSDQSLSGADYIYINIQFTGYINRTGISITYT